MLSAYSSGGYHPTLIAVKRKETPRTMNIPQTLCFDQCQQQQEKWELERAVRTA